MFFSCMADPKAIVPYHDPFDSPFSETVFNFDDDSNPSLADLDAIDDSYFTMENLTMDAFDGPLNWEICDNDPSILNNSQSGLSGIKPETSNQEEEEENFQTQFGNFTTPVAVWPVPAVPFMCSCCQVLREIIHTNGTHITRLEIHGRLGIICHAVLEDRNNVVDVVSSGHNYQMFDFCKKSIGNVKQFLLQYCEERKRAGYIMQQDPLSYFYEALCVGLDWDENLNTDDDFIMEQSAEDSYFGLREINQSENQNHGERTPRTSLAAQRERTGRLTLSDFVSYFHLPIDVAAKKLNVCPTVVKKVCRRHGMNRWPYRKIKAHIEKISKLSTSLNTADVEESRRIQDEIEKIRQKIIDICGGVPAS